eukprot:scaffold6495_cov155-Skeletonema_marinoi.AAC.13
MDTLVANFVEPRATPPTLDMIAPSAGPEVEAVQSARGCYGVGAADQNKKRKRYHNHHYHDANFSPYDASDQLPPESPNELPHTAANDDIGFPHAVSSYNDSYGGLCMRCVSAPSGASYPATNIISSASLQDVIQGSSKEVHGIMDWLLHDIMDKYGLTLQPKCYCGKCECKSTEERISTIHDLKESFMRAFKMILESASTPIDDVDKEGTSDNGMGTTGVDEEERIVDYSSSNDMDAEFSFAEDMVVGSDNPNHISFDVMDDGVDATDVEPSVGDTNDKIANNVGMASEDNESGAGASSVASAPTTATLCNALTMDAEPCGGESNDDTDYNVGMISETLSPLSLPRTLSVATKTTTPSPSLLPIATTQTSTASSPSNIITLHTSSKEHPSCNSLNFIACRSSPYDFESDTSHDFHASQKLKTIKGLFTVGRENDISMDLHNKAYVALRTKRDGGFVTNSTMPSLVREMERLKEEGVLDKYTVVHIVFLEVVRVGLHEPALTKLEQILKKIDTKIKVKTIREWNYNLHEVGQLCTLRDDRLSAIAAISSKNNCLKSFVRSKKHQSIQDNIKMRDKKMEGDDGAIKRARDAFERGSKAQDEMKIPKAFSDELDRLIDMENGTDAKAAIKKFQKWNKKWSKTQPAATPGAKQILCSFGRYSYRIKAQQNKTIKDSCLDDEMSSQFLKHLSMSEKLGLDTSNMAAWTDLWKSREDKYLSTHLKTILYLVSRQQVSHTLLTSITRVGSQFFKNEFFILFHKLFGAKILCSDHIGCTDDLDATPDPTWDQTALQAARTEEKRRKLQREVTSQHNAARAKLVDGDGDGTDDPFRASAATAEVLDALSNRNFHPNVKRTLNASVGVDAFTMCDNGVILSVTSDNVQEWIEEMKIVARIENVIGENDKPMNLSLPKHVNSLDKSEKEQILNNFELGKDANKKARRSLFADEEKARKADARRAAAREKKEAEKAARRAADEEKARKADARRAAGALVVARWEADTKKKEAERAARRAAVTAAETAAREENHRVGALAVARLEADMKEMYQQLFYDKVVPKLKRLKFVDSKMLKSSMLTKTERCAFVFVYFKQFHKHKGIGQISHEGIKQILKAKMEKNNSWSNTLRETTSHNS